MVRASKYPNRPTYSVSIRHRAGTPASRDVLNTLIAEIKLGASCESLATASGDRSLMGIGRSPRFGTQYRSDGPNAPYRPHEIESGGTAELRRVMMVPSLAEAKAGEAKWNKR